VIDAMKEGDKMSKIDFSIPREKYFKDELHNSKKCPKCDSLLEKQYASYMVFIKGEEDALMMGNDAGLFCPKCPVVVLDSEFFAEGLSNARHKKYIYFHVAGIVNTDAIPEGKKGVPLGEDDNPIPLVEFISNKNKTQFNEKDKLQEIIKLEENKDFSKSVKLIEEILKDNPNSYHALFLKARVDRKTGNKSIDSLKKALIEAVKQDASKEVFELFEEEMDQNGERKNRFLKDYAQDIFIGLNHRDIEKAFGFNWYFELNDPPIPPRRQDQNKIVASFFDFADSDLRVIKTDNGEIKEVFDMPLEEIRENLISLEKDQGRFYDGILEISYAFLSDIFFGYVFNGMIFFSAKKDDTEKMARIYDKYGLKYNLPYELKGNGD